MRSATPFCCGVRGADVSWVMPCSSKNRVNSSDVNSPPLSDRKNLICRPVSFSIMATNALKVLSVLSFDLRKYVHTWLEWSHVKTHVYLAPPMDVTSIGPMRSAWMRSIGFVDRVARFWEDLKVLRFAFPAAQPSQVVEGGGVESRVIPRSGGLSDRTALMASQFR